MGSEQICLYLPQTEELFASPCNSQRKPPLMSLRGQNVFNHLSNPRPETQGIPRLFPQTTKCSRPRRFFEGAKVLKTEPDDGNLASSMCVCVCLYMCLLFVYIYIYIHIDFSLSKYIYIYIYIYIYVFQRFMGGDFGTRLLSLLG